MIFVQMPRNIEALQEQHTGSAASNISSVAEHSFRFLTAFFSFLLLDSKVAEPSEMRDG